MPYKESWTTLKCSMSIYTINTSYYNNKKGQCRALVNT